MKIYDEGSKKLIHIDLYRINKSEEIYDLGINDYLYNKNITIIEWFEKAEKQLNPNCIIYFTVLGQNSRELRAEFHT
jgi:tRNA threonylcarbamoyladenosine biosynthesis protein TsaE